MGSISPQKAADQGTAAADDAVTRAAAVGLGKGAPIYFDMEAFDIHKATCVQAVLDFLDAWTRRIRANGYVSGVYGSSGSTITKMVQADAAGTFTAPDDVWFANWNNQAQADSDPYIPSTSWPDHQRIHQYSGGHVEHYGGVSINIDQDFVDGAVVGSPAEGSFVKVDGVTYRVAGGAPMLVTDCSALGGCHPIQTLASLSHLAPVPAGGTVLQGAETGRTYVVAGGAALPVTTCVANKCASPIALNQQTISSGAEGRLQPLPANGTILRGVPSTQLWNVTHACREQTTNSSSVVRLADADLETLFAPCTGRLVFARGRTGARQLVAMNADGAGVAQLTHVTGDAASPAVSPDGSRIAFVRTMQGNPDVWVMNADGTGLKRLTASPGFDGDPAWSPNGTKIVFASARAGSKDLWTMRADGTGQHRLLDWRSTEAHPAYSPDGTQIAFQSDKAGHLQLYVLRLGAKTRRLTDRDAADVSPSWSPDGSTIVFSSNAGGTWNLWTVRPTGTPSLTQLTHGPAVESAPVWSPDGLRVAFVSNLTGSAQVWAVRADGRQPVRYSKWPAPSTTPAWGSG
jgi:TolB protein